MEQEKLNPDWINRLLDTYLDAFFIEIYLIIVLTFPNTVSFYDKPI